MANLKIKLILLAWLQLQPMLCMISGASIAIEQGVNHEKDPNQGMGEHFRPKPPVERLECGQGKPVGKPHDDNESILAKIINAKAAKPGEFPFQVLIETPIILGQEIRNKCGGVLIDGQHVLTAASCIMETCFSGSSSFYPPKNLLVTLGEYSRLKGGDGERYAVVSDHYAHEKFNCTNLNDDIALLRLAMPVSYRLTANGYGSINRVCMQGRFDNVIKVGEKVVVTGWGKFKPETGYADILQRAQMEVRELNECSNEVSIDRHRLTKYKQLCALKEHRSRCPCDGDTGGPVMRIMKNGHYELVGLVNLANCDKAAIFTSVSYYSQWINEKIESG